MVKLQSLLCLRCRRVQEGLKMTPVMIQHGKELNHSQALAGCSGTTVPGRLDDPWQSTRPMADHQIMWVGRYLWRSPAQPPPQTQSTMGSHQVAQGFIQVGHKTLQGWREHGHTEPKLHLCPNMRGCNTPIFHVC